MLTSSAVKFGDLKKGTRARVVSIQETEELKRLMEMGLTVDTEFQVMKVAPFGDTIEIKLRGYSLCLRKGEAEGVIVEILE